ncbi:cyclin-A2-1-like isoform X2 [Phalaenopsis equestris]|uniref:cyclin-A2-1-like isoform X2 n=1 Tax=Phalaenopsis equestris TaxID=78828 RepID=UPI0009E3994D|nr:cyclin-A2-1-like isoform X2 [Phalaenopsis equestris]
MNKQASVVPSYGKNKGPVTRARAASLASHGRRLLPRPPLIPDKKQTKVGRTKRVISEENNPTAPYAVTSQNKKRAVLKDVSNVCRESSYRNCANAVKIQAKDCKQQVRPENLKAKTSSDQRDLKSTPAISSSFEQHHDGNAGKCVVDMSENLSVRESSFTTANLDGTMQNNNLDGTKMEVKGILSEDQDFNCSGIHDIDLDLSNPQMCSLYAKDIYANLRASELIRRASSTFMETLQREITPSMRGILIDWLVEVAEEYKLVPDTLYLSVYAIDRFLSGNCIERQKLQLLGVTCMLIASKYEEICAPRVEEFCFITDNTYTKEDVLKMEVQVLSYLDFRLSVPTIKTFLRRFLRAAQASHSLRLLCSSPDGRWTNLRSLGIAL